MNLSIVIVNYKTPQLTINCINSIYKSESELSYEIIVVDNNSQDDSLKLIRKNFPKVKIIENEINEGFGRANNLGIKIAEGEYVFFLNSDVVLKKNTLQKCLEKIKSQSNIGVLSCKLLNEDQSVQRVKFYFAGSFKYYLKQNLIIDKLFSFPKKELKAVIGAFMIIPKNVLDQVKGFDPDFFMYSEELELCDRIRKLGYKIKYYDEVCAVHLHGGSTTNNKWSLLQKEVSNQLYFRKKFGFFGYLLLHFLRVFNLFTNFIAMWLLDKNYRKGYYQVSKNYFKSMKYFFSILFWRKRKNRFLKVSI